MLIYLLLVIAGYLAGSFSSAIIVCKLYGGDDPRRQGSKNPGATNVLRLHGKVAAVLTLLGDVTKGLAPVLLASLLGAPDLVIALTAVAAFLGHLFPVYFGFTGGKGIATFVGVLFGMYWPLGIAFSLTWILVALVFRYSSLAGLSAALLTPVYAWKLLPETAYLVSILCMVILMFWRHRSNIRNLVTGKEDKIRFRKAMEQD